MLFGLFMTKSERIDQLEDDVADLTRELAEECLANHNANEALTRVRAERDGVRIALKAAERQLAQANDRLAVLTTRGPGGRFVKVHPDASGNGVLGRIRQDGPIFPV